MKILIDNRQKRIKINKRTIRTQVVKLLKLTGCSNKEISITFVDDEAIRLINKQYLSRDHTTNVISFSFQEGEYSEINPDLLGDIIISVDTAQRDAKAGHLHFEEEILFLMIHGFLHIIGYNHENTSLQNSRKMKKKERELFDALRSSE